MTLNLPKDAPKESDFKDYLLSEYSNIAQAHFTTMETISSFFRNYLVIVAIPISLIAAAASIFKSENLLSLLSSYKLPLAVMFLAVSLTGIGVLLYIVNLRMDAILYARTINGIRKYFFGQSKIDIQTQLRIRVLPQSPSLPAYHEKAYFWPVVFTFAVFNGVYFLFGLSSLTFTGTSISSVPVWIPILAALFGLGHFPLYWGYAQHRETSYLQSNIIGVDIDGVLNKHREHFCKLLDTTRGKVIDPNNIKAIPVHECEQLQITREDERAVFNNPEYWEHMPSIEGAAENLKKLHNALKLKVFIFTYRPWPDVIPLSPIDRTKTLSQWKIFGGSKKGVEQITRQWLAQKEIKYDKLIIEKGNENLSDPQGHVKNRFFESRKRRIKFFIEDDLEKAIKLAYICEVVFLVDQPYNQFMGEEPHNLIRVKSWDEIFKKIRAIS
jgi:uncharacterized HAD superfamily protein